MSAGRGSRRRGRASSSPARGWRDDSPAHIAVGGLALVHRAAPGSSAPTWPTGCSRSGRPVLIYDDLSRPGRRAECRLAARRSTASACSVRDRGLRNREALRSAVRDAEQVFHFAAQVAVTTSLIDPLHDFEVNAGGTLNLLEAIRALDSPPPLLFTSTNKVYGGLPTWRWSRTARATSRSTRALAHRHQRGPAARLP